MDHLETFFKKIKLNGFFFVLFQRKKNRKGKHFNTSAFSNKMVKNSKKDWQLRLKESETREHKEAIFIISGD